MEAFVGRLEGSHGREGVEMVGKSRIDDTFENFRDKVQVGYRAVT